MQNQGFVPNGEGKGEKTDSGEKMKQEENVYDYYGYNYFRPWMRRFAPQNKEKDKEKEKEKTNEEKNENTDNNSNSNNTNNIINNNNSNNNSNNNTNNTTPTKNLIGNNPMLREIEDYVQKNMNEMYQALEELKASFQEEINEAEENGFSDIADGLKQDLQVELDNLKDQYEEQRITETEKIKAKYANRNAVIVS